MITAALGLFYEKLQEFAVFCYAKWKGEGGRKMTACCKLFRSSGGKDELGINWWATLTREAGISLANDKLHRRES